MTKKLTVSVPAGHVMAFTTDAVTLGRYTRLAAPGGTVYTPTTMDVSTAYSEGPFNEVRDFAFDYQGADISYTLTPSGVYTAADDVALALLAPIASPTFTGTVVVPTPFTIGAVSMTATGTELNFVDGVTSAIQTQIDTKKPNVVTANVGTINSGTTVSETGDGFHHTSVLTVSTVLPAIAGGADLSVGKLLYTFPAGAIVVDNAYMSIAITQSEGNINADTADIGLGTTIAAGANALVSTTAGAENILTGQTAADCNGTATVKTVADQVLVIEAAGDHGVYLNAADGWAASGDTAAAIAGTVVLNWHFIA